MRIYLDHNVIVSAMRRRIDSLPGDIEAWKSTNSVFPYSPAHLEEIAVILREQADYERAIQHVAEHLAFIEELSECWELLPADDSPTRIEKEAPSVCMTRVLRDYDVTSLAEENERFQMSFKSASAFDQVQEEFGTQLRASPGVPLFDSRRASYGVDVRAINRLSEDVVLNDSAVQKGLSQKLWHHSLTLDTLPKSDDLLASHATRELVVPLVLNYLEEIGYRADPFKKYRGHMHDVSHAIYAAATDVFVTDDDRYRLRVRAAYHFLGIPTRVLNSEEFHTFAPDITT
jgi:hypothetical protein